MLVRLFNNAESCYQPYADPILDIPRLRSVHALPTISTPITSRRHESSVAQKDPKKTAQSLLNSLPGETLVAKTAILSAGTGLSVAAISNELYVFNEESIVMLSLLTVYWAVAHYGGPMYKEWAENQINKEKNILVEARKGHATKVQERIEKVRNLSDVIGITRNLFAVSKVRLRSILKSKGANVSLGNCPIGSKGA